MGAFHIFLIVQMVPNRAKHHILAELPGDNASEVNIENYLP